MSFGTSRTSSANAPHKRGMSLTGNNRSQFQRSSTASGSQATVGATVTRQRHQQTPNGRVEMLLWLEAITGRTVESIERLRDGISYFLVLCDIIAKCPDYSVARHLELVNDAAAKVVGAPVIPLGDYPGQDSIQVIGACEKNLQILQGLIRSTLPKKCAFEMDTTKMAKGTMQDHMVFLKWLVALPKKLEATAIINGVSATGPATASSGSGMARTRSAGPRIVPNRNKDQQRTASSSTVRRGEATVNSPKSPKRSSAGVFIDKELLDLLTSIEKEVTSLETASIKAPKASSDIVQLLIKERDTLSDLLISIAGLIEDEEVKRGPKGCECPLREELIKTVFE